MNDKTSLPTHQSTKNTMVKPHDDSIHEKKDHTYIHA